MPIPWLSTRFRVALMWLLVALRGLQLLVHFQVSAFCFRSQVPISRFEVRGSRFRVRCSASTISLPNPSPLPRLPRGGLGAPWTNPGHGPGTIEPPQTPVFDQPRLSSSLHSPPRRLSPAHAVGSGEHARRRRRHPAPSPGGLAAPESLNGEPVRGAQKVTGEGASPAPP